MRLVIRLLAAFALASSFYGGSKAETVAERKNLKISAVWAEPAAADASTRLHMFIENVGFENLLIVDVTSPFISGATFMVEVQPGEYQRVETVPIPKEDTVGLHTHHMSIRLENLSRELAVGDSLSVTLHFSHDAPWTITVPVREGRPVHGRDPYH